MNQDITGGVTPLKARKSAGKAGKVGKKATATRAQDKSGFSRSDTIDTGKGYKANLESLTAGMRTQGSLAAALGAKGPGGQPTKRDGKKDDFGGSSTFEETDNLGPETEFKTETETKTVKTDQHGEVVTEMDDACSAAYIAKHGDAKCKEYKEFRKNNPVDRSKRSSKKVDFKTGYYRTRKDKNSEWSDWMPTKGTKYEKK
jgi:hypothetical protein